MLSKRLISLLDRAMAGEVKAFEMFKRESYHNRGPAARARIDQAMMDYMISGTDWSKCCSEALSDLVRIYMETAAESRYSDFVGYVMELGESHPAIAAQMVQQIKNEDDTNELCNLAGLYDEGRVHDGRTQEARDEDAVLLYQKAADKGNGAALNSLATMYHLNRVHDNDDQETHDKKIVQLYRQAIKKKVVVALNNLALMHQLGRVHDGRDQVAHDEEAVKLHKKAIKYGNKKSLNNLGIMYEEGRVRDGRDQIAHDAEAAKLYQEAIKAGEASAIINFVALLLEGRVRDNITLVEHLQAARNYLMGIVVRSDTSPNLIDEANKLLEVIRQKRRDLMLNLQPVAPVQPVAHENSYDIQVTNHQWIKDVTVKKRPSAALFAEQPAPKRARSESDLEILAEAEKTRIADSDTPELDILATLGLLFKREEENLSSGAEILARKRKFTG